MTSATIELSKIIRQERRKREISQYDIAEYIGISQAHYCRFEKGKSDLKITQVERAIQFLNLEISFIIKDLDD